MPRHTGRIGFRIVTDPPRPDATLVDRFRGLPSSLLADAMGRFHFMDPGIAARTGGTICGVAVTVNTRPADNLMVHKAFGLARAGDVLVVSTNGGRAAVLGEILCRAAHAAGFAGAVVDGGVRDVEAIAGFGFPLFSRYVSAGAGHKDGPGEVNVPIACGNTVVMPGDIVVGDADGVVVVPLADAEEVLARVDVLLTRERDRLRRVADGDLLLDEVDATLRARGFDFEAR